MSELTAQAKGMAKQMASVLKGRAGIYATLAKEHGEVASLLKQALQTSSQDKRANLLDKIRVELLSHSHAEEQTLYDELSRHDSTRGRAHHNREEHEEIERLLAEALGESSKASIERLEQVVSHHVEEEENDLFIQADELLSREQERALNERFKELKASYKRKLESDGFGMARGPLSA